MARRASSDSTPSEGYKVTGPDFKGLLLLLLSLITFLALLGIGYGRLNEMIAHALRWMVGWGAYPLTLLVGGVGVMVLLRRERETYLGWGRLLALEFLALSLLGLTTLLTDPTLPLQKAATGEAGGVTGWLVAQLALLSGPSTAILILIPLSLLLAFPVFGFSLERLQTTVDRQRWRLERRRERLLAAPEPAPSAPQQTPQLAAGPPARTEPPTGTGGTAEQATSGGIGSKLTGILKGRTGNSEESRKRPPASTERSEPSSTAPFPAGLRYKYALPTLDLLHRSSDSLLDPDIAREKARVIEETLRSFNVPARVVQVNQGPAVTQFGVQPGFIEQQRSDGTVKRRKVKVSAITSLADDLALALAAKSIRVEAPVPGRPYVGIEVPNSDTELVTLHSVMTSQEFKQIDSDLTFALGRDVSGHPVAADLARMPHLLIAGATGAGKSVCVNTIITSLLFNLGPERLKLLMIDPKMVELIPYNGIPHLIAPVVTDMERAVGALTWAMREMDRRYKLFSEAGKRNFQSYNRWADVNGKETLPYIVIIIDELADLMMVAADQVERLICRIAQMARATGIHLLLATQRPSVDVVTGLIKANVPARIAFAVTSQVDSRVILDTSGAETLLGQGDMLFQAPDASKLQRLQGCFVSDQELQAVVGHWLRYNEQESPSSDEKTPWDKILDEIQEPDDEQDELLGEAIAIVQEHQWASTSFLQRKLRIGYTRAARLIDALEERGIVGPPEEGSNGSRAVLIDGPAQNEPTND